MRLKKTLLILISLSIGISLSVGCAGIFKCTTPQGQRVFQDRSCRDVINPALRENVIKEPISRIDKHFLWKASSKVNTVYLFGSIHFGSTEMYPLPDVVTQAYNSSDALIVEVNTNLIDPRTMTLTLAQSGSYPKGETVKDHLSPETWEKLTRMAKKQQMDLKTLQSLKPWMISLGLNVLAIKKSGFSPEFGIDQYFITRAERRKPILELESGQQQMELLSTSSTIEQDKMLKKTLDQLENTASFFRSVLEAWQTGDTRHLKDLILRDIDTDPDTKSLYEALFTIRNHAMTDKIVKLSESGKNYFVVVGAGHLVGEEGIVELLRDRGYEVTQL